LPSRGTTGSTGCRSGSRGSTRRWRWRRRLLRSWCKVTPSRYCPTPSPECPRTSGCRHHDVGAVALPLESRLRFLHRLDDGQRGAAPSMSRSSPPCRMDRAAMVKAAAARAAGGDPDCSRPQGGSRLGVQYVFRSSKCQSLYGLGRASARQPTPHPAPQVVGSRGIAGRRSSAEPRS
jgi:hypothetical protein